MCPPCGPGFDGTSRYLPSFVNALSSIIQLMMIGWRSLRARFTRFTPDSQPWSGDREHPARRAARFVPPDSTGICACRARREASEEQGMAYLTEADPDIAL